MYVPHRRVEMHELIIADRHRIRERNEGDVHCDRMPEYSILKENIGFHIAEV